MQHWQEPCVETLAGLSLAHPPQYATGQRWKGGAAGLTNTDECEPTKSICTISLGVRCDALLDMAGIREEKAATRHRGQGFWQFV